MNQISDFFRKLDCHVSNFISNIRKKFSQWIMSDNFPLHLAVLFLISFAFDYFLTFQILFNDRELFLKLEQNDFLVYCYQNNLWWLFASVHSSTTALLFWYVVVYVKKAPKFKKIVRIVALFLPINQLINTLLFVLK